MVASGSTKGRWGGDIEDYKKETMITMKKFSQLNDFQHYSHRLNEYTAVVKKKHTYKLQLNDLEDCRF